MYASAMIDAASILFLTLFSLLMIICLIDCCCCYKVYQRGTLPRSSIPPITHQPHLISPMHRGSHQNNARTSISHSTPRLTSTSSPIPRNYGMLHIPLAVEEPNRIEPASNEIRRSNQVGNTMLFTYPSWTMDSMPREPPIIPAGGAFRIALNLQTVKSTECAVCLGDLQGEEIVKMHECVHWFHKNCILEWLWHQPSCPLCRSPANFHQMMKSITF